jgi:hypothetical protein
MGIMKALAWAADQKGFGDLDPNGYRDGYQALRRLFRDFVRPDDYPTVLAGAYATYGWIPTIMKPGVDKTTWCNCENYLGTLQAAADWTEAEVVLSEAPEILTLMNGSLIGTSKFLHFLNPKIFPIWDLNIGRVFYALPQDVVEKKEDYFKYCSVIDKAIRDKLLYPEAYVDFVGSDVSEVRKLELLLFLYGQSLG